MIVYNDILRGLKNSVCVCVCTTAVVMVYSFLLAFERLRTRASSDFVIVLIFTMMMLKILYISLFYVLKWYHSGLSQINIEKMFVCQ